MFNAILSSKIRFMPSLREKNKTEEWWIQTFRKLVAKSHKMFVLAKNVTRIWEKQENRFVLRAKFL
jgi:hypothetical protein